MERVNYTDFEGGFNQVVLEESFVLNLKTTMSFVDFQMNFAVNEQYPLHTPPEEDFEYCFRRGRIFFPNMEQVRWTSRIQPYIDPGSGGVDYGAIDYFYLEDGWYHLAGFWGELDIVSGPPILEIEELLNQPREQQQSATGSQGS
jgi:hypothetical protein